MTSLLTHSRTHVDSVTHLIGMNTHRLTLTLCAHRLSHTAAHTHTLVHRLLLAHTLSTHADSHSCAHALHTLTHWYTCASS